MRSISGELVRSLYIHVPFCARKCEYCAFYSEAADGELVNRYVQALVRELEIVSPRLQPRTVFFGGGTPSLLNLRQWETILSAMERLNLLGAEEWTVECNPATVSCEKARLLRGFGVNRVSMGVQSLDPVMLERLGRVHSRDMVFKSFDILRQAGFENINLDLMFAIPGQTFEVWRKTLEEALAFQSEHLSCYEVIYEEDTPLFAQLQAGEFEVDEDLACRMYEALVETVEEANFQQYEIANFARRTASDIGQLSGRACQHNVNYWRGGDYFGLGPSAAEYVDGIRRKNSANTRVYCDTLARGLRATDFQEELPPLRRAGETAAFGLRMGPGWEFHDFKRRTGFDLREQWNSEIEHCVSLGWAESDAQGLRLTRQGLRFADAVAEMFLR